jgi:tight adherence protein B
VSAWVGAVSAAAVVLLLWAPVPAVSSRRWERAGWAVPPVMGLGIALRPGPWTLLAAIVICALWCGHALWTRRREGRDAAETSARVVEVCDLLAAELSAGRPAEAALREAVGAWPRLGPVADSCLLGGDVPLALRTLAHTPGAGGLRMLAGALAVSQRTGAGLAGSARRAADAVRREQSTRRLVAGELSSARATARLVAGLPVLALTMGSGAGADPWALLVRTPLGLACLAGGLAIGFLGLWWIELIARGVEA